MEQYKALLIIILSFAIYAYLRSILFLKKIQKNVVLFKTSAIQKEM